MSETVGTITTTQEPGAGESGIVRRWVLELELADKQEKAWRKDAESIIKRYRGELFHGADSDGNQARKQTFNILWSNTETLRPALYNSTPKPDVRRRFRDEDIVGKAVSEILERCLVQSMDCDDFDGTMIAAVNDYLLPGRSVTRVRYVPTLTKTEAKPEAEEDGETEEAEEVTYEEATTESVQWDDFRRGPGRTWGEVEWIAFRHRLTRAQLSEKFEAQIAEAVPLDDEPEGLNDRQDVDAQDKSLFKRAVVWEIWDREKRQVVFISKEFKTKPLKVEPDPLTLRHFYPVPRPMYSMESTSSLVPVPEYVLYQTLADELDTVTRRIVMVLKGLRLRGIYPSHIAELEQLFSAGDNKMIPAQNMTELLAAMGDAKSLSNVIWMLPVKDYAAVLVQLYEYRKTLIEAIYELTGISDILRGASAPSESATAQNIKANWGTQRLQRRQREVQRYARDLIRLLAEIIAEKFQRQTWQLMSGKKYPTQQEKDGAQQQIAMMQQQAQAQGQPAPVPPELQQMLTLPSWEEIEKVMRSDLLRDFRVDIETDSTIQAQLQEDQKNITDLLTGIAGFFQSIGPAVESGAMPIEAAKALLMAAVRRFKLGNEVEDALDKIQAPPPNQGHAQAQQQAQQDHEANQAIQAAKANAENAKSQALVARANLDAQQAERDAQYAAAEHEQRMQELAMKSEIANKAHTAKIMEIAMQATSRPTEPAMAAQ